MASSKRKSARLSTSSATVVGDLNPRTTHFEFLGPVGAFGFVTTLPLLVLFFGICCNQSGYPSKLLLDDYKTYFEQLLSGVGLKAMFDPMATLVYLAFVGLQAALYMGLPGDLYPGTKLRNGDRLKYRMNGFRAYNATLLIGLYLLKDTGLKPLLFVYDHWVGLVTTSILFSYAIALFVYLKSFAPGTLLALGGNSGNALYDFMIGRELNPRVGDFDIKFFTELRPGIIGWQVLNICFAAKQYVDLGYITNSMVLVQAFQAWYIADSFWNEKAILTTMDFTTDGFGFMLAFGLYSWLPMNYTLQARYLVDNPRDLSWMEFGLILCLNIIGYYIFRSSNIQKNQFRINPNHPSVKDLKYITTSKGTKLITSSWWGISRHINYLGDWLMSLSWCLPCGFGSLVPYFYAIYFAILLLHRERRDDQKCRTKYGKDWEKYCDIVKYRIIPGIY